MTILEIKNLEKYYDDFHALNNLSLSIPEQSIFGILGPNGSGKSTLMRILAGLIRSWKGGIFFRGKELNYKNTDILKNFGFMIESPTFYEYLTAYDNLSILSRLTKTREKRIFEVLELVKLEKRMDEKVKTFSYGMKQRLGIAQSLLHNPEILVLDEPNNGLDPPGIRDMDKLINFLNDEGKTILISTHILGEVESLCTDVSILRDGKLLKSLNMKQTHLDNNKFKVVTDDVEKAKSIIENHRDMNVLRISTNSILIVSKKATTVEKVFNILNGEIILDSISKHSNLLDYFYD